MTDKMRVAAVDDHPIFLAGFERAVRRVPEIELIALGSCGADALRIARTLQPDVMLLDISMPGNGIEIARQITRDHAGIKIIILTASNDDEQLSLALSAGAVGFLLKGIQLPELLEAVRAVHRGETYMAPEVATRLLAQKIKLERKMQVARQTLRNLNTREQEILLNMANGSTNQEIAERMQLTTSTVKTYISRIFDKMHVRNRVQAVGLALGDVLNVTDHH
jgi:two-component system, NarL family, nitrate/nitrite response regulator NarL